MLLASSLRLPLSACFKSRALSLVFTRRFRMASESKDVSSQTDISKMKTSDDGSFKRAPMVFRNVIEKGGKFEPELGVFVWFSWTVLSRVNSDEIGRYHLYVSYACRAWISISAFNYLNWLLNTAWATRTLIVRKLKGLDGLIRGCPKIELLNCSLLYLGL